MQMAAMMGLRPGCLRKPLLTMSSVGRRCLGSMANNVESSLSEGRIVIPCEDTLLTKLKEIK